MKIKDLFREILVLAVRLLALFLFYKGVTALTGRDEPLFRTLSPGGVVSAVIYFAAAFWLVKGPVIRWACPEPVAPASEAGVESIASPQEPIPDKKQTR